jgi:hypothetical protein
MGLQMFDLFCRTAVTNQDRVVGLDDDQIRGRNPSPLPPAMIQA